MTDRLALLIWAATPEQPALVVTPLVHALAARALDAEVEIHFAGPAVRWLVSDVADAAWPTPAREKSVGDFLRELAVADTKEEMLEQFRARFAEPNATGKNAPAKGKFSVYTKRKQEGVFIGKKIGREYIDLKKLPDVAAARAYLESNTAEIRAIFKGLTPYQAEGKDYLLTPEGWKIIHAGTVGKRDAWIIVRK